ncbi:adenylate/guanylate cyclase domain-containing protein [Mycolicibacterium sp.]|uniref:adenylate/guanylate cyclase domain-containing protein n=1 Tax=Mycolicibacterium sp. TaxID=2320850 RepID=UPI0028AD0F72|nr:adenylate/guanylate cyclase domain-containing protein [Mycolicibacterium sp.]
MAQEAEPDAPDRHVRKPHARIRRRNLLNRISIQSKLILMLVLCTVLAAAIVGGIAYQSGRNSLRTAAVNRLTEILESQRRALTSDVNDLRSALVTYTNGSSTRDALRDFAAGFDQLANAPITPEMDRAIRQSYNAFAKQTEEYSGTRLDVAALLPTSNAERYLQATYTAKLPTAELALAAEDQRDGSAWSAANVKYHNFFREIVTRFAFEDALLIDDRGNVVYSAYKNQDLGTNILTGPYNGSKLREAFQQAMSSNKADRVIFTDFEFYQPADMAPTAWMVAPVPPNGKPAGVLAMQFPITKINRIMTFDKKWSEAGMGATGETIMAGEDYLMRSDSRMFLEDPERYRQMVIDAGTPPDIPDIAIRQGGTTLIQPVAPEAHREAEKGYTGTLFAKDYLGKETIQAYAPAGKVADLRWSIVAKIDTTEAFAREATFTRIVVLATTGIIFGVCLLALILAQVFLRPIRRLEAGVQRISAGDYNVEIPVQTRDEIGDLTGMFNDMSRSLAVKEGLLAEQRSQIRRLMNSLMPAPVAEKYSQGEEVTAREHSDVTVIYADIGGLERLQAQLESTESLAISNELMRQFDAAAAEFGIERIRSVRNGFLGSCGLTIPRLDHIRRTVNFAGECQRIIERFNSEASLKLSLRAGIDTGTVSSGLVIEPSPVFDMWGTAVNLAHRIKNGMPDPGVYVTARVYDTLAQALPFSAAGTITVDGSRESVWRLTESP